MLLPRALLVPHLPTLLVDEHRHHRTPMLEALRRESARFQAEQPAIVVVLNAHAPSEGPFHVGSGRLHRSLTDEPGFGAHLRYDCPGHPVLARALVEAGLRAGVRVVPAARGLDRGASLPLHFLLPGRGVPVVPLTMAPRTAEECRAWGCVVRQVLSGRPERIGFVVGGMLSCATHAWNLHREVPEAAALDQHVLGALTAGRWDALRPADSKMMARAQPEAGLLHLEILRGFLDADVAGEVLCYDAGPGMGSALVAFEVPDGLSVAPEVPGPPEVEFPPAPARRQPNRASKPRPSRRPQRVDRSRRPSKRPRAGSGLSARSGPAAPSRRTTARSPTRRKPRRER